MRTNQDSDPLMHENISSCQLCIFYASLVHQLCILIYMHLLYASLPDIRFIFECSMKGISIKSQVLYYSYTIGTSKIPESYI